MEIIKNIIVFVALVIGFTIVIGLAVDLHETRRCDELRTQSLEYKDKGFFLSKYESEMCKRVKVEIVAPVSKE